MPVWGLFALLMANASSLEQSIPRSMGSEAQLQQLSAPDQKIKVLPFVIEGSVESFDPVERANELADKIVQKIKENKNRALL